MTPKELAALLTGAECRKETTPEIEARAEAAGLVIVFGASDDLMEFRGAIDDEIHAYSGTEVCVDQQGIIPDFDDLMERDATKDEFRDYFRREASGALIEALWCVEDDYSWTFRTTIPHETFEVLEDGDAFCRGIVFRLADAKAEPTS